MGIVLRGILRLTKPSIHYILYWTHNIYIWSLSSDKTPLVPADSVEVPHPACASSLPPAGLHGPPELPDLSGGEATGGAHLLLDVEGDLSTPTAQGVGLVAPLSKGTGSLSHGDRLFFWK